jgi:hypothetical protein
MAQRSTVALGVVRELADLRCAHYPTCCKFEKNPWNEVLSIFHIHHGGLDFLRLLVSVLMEKSYLVLIKLNVHGTRVATKTQSVATGTAHKLDLNESAENSQRRWHAAQRN